MADEGRESRRRFLRLAGGAGVGVSAVVRVSAAQDAPTAGPRKETEEEDVSPAEDLMREHGVLDRVLLIYDEAVRRLDANGELDPAPVAAAAGIVRGFIEDYHEKLEETELFPRFEKANKLADLVGVLRAQHQAGRRITEEIHRLAVPATRKATATRRQLAGALRQFNRMYRPHAAREDTVLFPAIHEIVSRAEYDGLGERFEKKEHELFGADGFEAMVDRVAAIEKSLGIFDLAQFTPK